MIIQPVTKHEVQKAIKSGLLALRANEPMTLSEWADENFYLSSESSYIEGKWETMPYQKAIMDCISNDDIRDVNLKKSARIGYSKMILAAIGYFAEHKRRNQGVWQPVDDDAAEFVKTEIETMLRDVPCVQAVFPAYGKKSKENTLNQKVFSGSNLFIRGGKAAKNYRRLTLDTVYLDELDGFDHNIEREGDPVTLASKRVEGSTFPKVVTGSTPKELSHSLIVMRHENAEMQMAFHIPCPHCEAYQPLLWGGKDIPYGFKWTDDDPHTAAYMCRECAGLFTQDKYLAVWERGRYQTEDGIWIDENGLFRDVDGYIVEAPLSISFEVWTAYSSMTSWTQIVREFLAANVDRGKLQTFVNTTLGEAWEEAETERANHEDLYVRREHYAAQVPDFVRVLTASIDTQDDRFEIQIDGWGAGEERAAIDYIRLYGDPSRQGIWDKLANVLKQSYRDEHGTLHNIRLAVQDHGGHYSDEVNQFSKRMGVRFLIPVKGSSIYGRPVATFPRKKNAKGVYLTEIGTDTAKDLMFQRLQVMEPGPGYWHFPIDDAFDRDYFKQLTAEERRFKWVQGKRRPVWDSKGRRNEPWDVSGYGLGAIRLLQQHFGVNLETPIFRHSEDREERPAVSRRTRYRIT